MKRIKLLKHLHVYGCRFKREGANHTIYTDASGMRQTAIPRHPEIKANTVRKIWALPVNACFAVKVG